MQMLNLLLGLQFPLLLVPLVVLLPYLVVFLLLLHPLLSLYLALFILLLPGSVLLLAGLRCKTKCRPPHCSVHPSSLTCRGPSRCCWGLSFIDLQACPPGHGTALWYWGKDVLFVLDCSEGR